MWREGQDERAAILQISGRSSEKGVVSVEETAEKCVYCPLQHMPGAFQIANGGIRHRRSGMFNIGGKASK